MCNHRAYILGNMILPVVGFVLTLVMLLHISKDHLALWISCIVVLIAEAIVAAIGIFAGYCAFCTNYASYEKFYDELNNDIEWGASDGMEYTASIANIFFYFLNFLCGVSVLVLGAVAYHVLGSHLFLWVLLYGAIFTGLSIVNVVGTCVICRKI